VEVVVLLKVYSEREKDGLIKGVSHNILVINFIDQFSNQL